MTSLGFSTIQFAQNSPAAIFTAQGNDIIGYAYITDNNGVEHQIPGFIKWRTTQGSTVKSIVFQPGATVFNLATNGSNGAATYTINGSSYIGLTFNGQTEVIPTTGGNAYEVSGNAATAGLLDALNLYLGSFPSISATNVTVSESAGNATITLTLSASSSNTVTVHYETADSTATQPTHYLPEQ
jgi:large repetitive protein